MTFKDLGALGDFGLVTVQALDSEMVGLDGQFYQIKSSGKTLRVSDSMKTPFAEVADNEEFYQADLTEDQQAALAKVESNPKK